jgi:phenylacetate-coenzyme A ligase PaaK-like adenylate-forming protein
MKSFEQLRALVEKCTHADAPPLYRDLYDIRAGQSALTLGSPIEWQSLPFLTKSHLLTIPIENRTFTPFENVDAYYHTSGTSGKKPLFVPKVLIPKMDFREQLFAFTRPALSSIGYQHRVEAFMESLGLPPRVIAIDPQRISISVHLAEVMGVESIFTSTFLIELIGKAMRPDAAREVRYIELTSEVCSQSLYAFIRRTFPHAMIVLSYGLNEIEDPCIGTVCEASTGDALDHTFHERGEDEHHLEIIDPNTEKPLPYVEGTEGELIVTSEAPGGAAFPLLRYRTGDIVRITETACTRHGKWRFTVLGRAALDFVRVTGGTIRADEVARAIIAIGKPFTDEFELHLDTHGPRLKATLHVRLDGKCDSSILAALMREIRVSPNKSFADAVTEGIFLPIECEPLSPRETPKKRPRLVRS